MELYVLTHMSQDNQYRPQIFNDLFKAQLTLTHKYNELIKNDKTFIQWKDKGTDWAKIIFRDDSFDELEIFTIQV